MGEKSSQAKTWVRNGNLLSKCRFMITSFNYNITAFFNYNITALKPQKVYIKIGQLKHLADLFGKTLIHKQP